MKPALAALLLSVLATPAAFGLEWKTKHLSIQAAPLQRTTATTFEFINTSDRTVKITNVDTSCDCLDAKPSAQTFAPGARGTINAQFNLTGAAGKLQRTIVVSTDEGTPATALTVELDVPEVATFTPRSVEWKLGSEAKEAVVDITVVAGLDLTISNVQPTSAAFTHRLEVVEPGRHFRLHLAPKDATKPANAAIRLFAQAATGEELVFSAYANVR
jgi:hypothetical protein